MKFEPTAIAGASLITPERRADDRGHFARAFCRREFAEHGIEMPVAQANSAFNKYRGTLRGLHYSVLPSVEAKVVRCVRGAIFDALIDLRPESSTYLRTVGVTLSADNGHALYVPPGVGHGYLTLADDAEVFYQVSDYYRPDTERGLRFNDPVVDIAWPITPSILSDKDLAWPDYVKD